MSTFINNAQIMIGDIVAIDFNHVINNKGNEPVRIVMTYEHLKKFHEVIGETMLNVEKQIAERNKAKN